MNLFLAPPKRNKQTMERSWCVNKEAFKNTCRLRRKQTKKINSRKCCAAKWKMTVTNNIQSYDMQIRKMHLHIKLARWSKIVTNVCTEVSDLKIKAKKKRRNEVEKWHRVCSINEIIFASVKTTSWRGHCKKGVDPSGDCSEIHWRISGRSAGIFFIG